MQLKKLFIPSIRNFSLVPPLRKYVTPNLSDRANEKTIVTEKRLAWADACRVLATFGVILIHTSAPVFYDSYSRSDFFSVANFLDSFSRVSVPLFLLLSGLFCLNAKISMGSVSSRITRVALPLIFWSLIYFYRTNGWSGDLFGFLDSAFHAITRGPVKYHLWFVYMIIGLYILLPLLVFISKELIINKKFAVYFFTLWFCVNCITIYYPVNLMAYYPVDLLKQFKIFGFLAWPGFFILGFYLVHAKILPNISSAIYGLVYIVACLGTFILTWLFSASLSKPSEIAYQYLSPNVVVASVALFLMFKNIRIPDRFRKLLAYISDLTFPIYLMHVLVIELLVEGVFGFSLSSYFIHPIIGIPLLTIATFLVSLGIAALGRIIIPYSSRIIG